MSGPYLAALRVRRYAFVALLCAAVRLTLFCASRPWAPDAPGLLLRGDAAGYHEIALTLLHSHRFAHGPDAPPDALRTPVYPGYVAMVYAVFGARPALVLLGQVLLDCASCLLLLASLAPLFGVTAATAAAVFFALDPFLGFHSSATLLSDTLFVFLLVTSFWALTRAGARAPAALPWVGASGVALGLAALTRPVAEFVPAIFAIFLFARDPGAPKRAAAQVAVLAFAFALVVAPWLARNEKVFGRASLSTSGAYNLLVLDAAPLVAAREHRGIPESQALLLAEADSLMREDGRDPSTTNEFERADYWRRVAANTIARNPAGFASAYVRGVAFLFMNLNTAALAEVLRLPAERVDVEPTASATGLVRAFVARKGGVGVALAACIAPYLLVSYACLAIGVLVAWGRYPDQRWWLGLLAATAAYFVVVTGPAGLARFKLPAIPFYLAFAGIGWECLRERFRRQADKSSVAAPVKQP